MASNDLVNSVQGTISNTQKRVTELEEKIGDAEDLARKFLERAKDMIEEAKIYKSQLRNEKILLSESVATLSTLLIDQPRFDTKPFTDALKSTPELAKDLEAALNG